MKKNYDSLLIVVAHPDDEILGAGGLAAVLAAKGFNIRACILSSRAELRRNKPDDNKLMDDIKKANEIIGMLPPILGEFPNINFNTVPHHELVSFIEETIIKTKANYIFTHFPGDLNEDHRETSLACQAACRLFQRTHGVPSLNGLYFMEILSSTEWAFYRDSFPFYPDSFFNIEKGLSKKIEALRAYRGVLRKYPHPRSIDVIKSLAAFRGSQAGFKYAEAFVTGFNVLCF